MQAKKKYLTATEGRAGAWRVHGRFLIKSRELNHLSRIVIYSAQNTAARRAGGCVYVEP